jgi:F0F1-type ATP synthase membrane subunit b/b'
MEEILKKFDLVPADVTMIVVGALLFVLFWKTFGKLVIVPFAELVAARERATIGADEAAHELHEKAKTLSEQYENRLTEERVKSLRVKFDAVANAKAAAAKVVAEAEAKAQEQTKSARAEIATQLHTLRSQALRETESVAQAMADKAKSAFAVQ